MSRRKPAAIRFLIILSVSLITSSLTALLLTNYYNRLEYQGLDHFVRTIIDRQPEARQVILVALKEYRNGTDTPDVHSILRDFGYQQSYFLPPGIQDPVLLAGTGLMAGLLLFLSASWLTRRRIDGRIRGLTAALEQVNDGGRGLLLSTAEDECSKLQDEIYKTVTKLYQAGEAAETARKRYADNLANIAHQLKTPITAISLSAQMMAQHSGKEYPDQIKKQLGRLTHLEESLLLLARIDAGTLMFKPAREDVFTLLVLAADHLQELLGRAEVYVDIEENGPAEVDIDLEWTMEAVINLLKNCMQHTPAGKTIYGSYELNPLYARIQIRDEGTGFDPADLPHLFERFYRGRNAVDAGIGIGLSLAKEIIEIQNGVIHATNHPDGGACFEIRFYRH